MERIQYVKDFFIHILYKEQHNRQKKKKLTFTFMEISKKERQTIYTCVCECDTYLCEINEST